MARHWQVAVLMAFPALVWIGMDVSLGNHAALALLLPNYLFLSAPHWFYLGVAALQRQPSGLTRLALLALNLSLLGVALWLRLTYLPAEISMGWTLYLPLAAIALLAAHVAYARRHPAETRQEEPGD